MSTVSGKKIKFVALSIISLPTLFQSPITYAEERKTEEDQFYRSGAQLIQTGNHESITSGTFVGDAYGGSDKLGGDVTLNSLTVSGNGTKLDGAGYGGYTENGGNIFDNAISITDGAEVTQHVYGGWSDTGDISENTVTVSGGSQIKGSIYGGQSGGGSISQNSVTVSDGNTVVEGSVMGGSTAGASGAMSDNDVTIRSGATVKGGVYGAHDRNASSSFDMIGNTVEVRGSGTEVGWVTGGYTLGSGTSSNVVVVKDSAAVAQDVYGGFSQNGAAKNNYVSITGGTVGRDVAGGYSFYGQATKNKVIVGHSQISGSIYGGYGGGYDTSIDLISDNEFHLVSALRLGSDQTVANFEKYNFDIGADIEAGDTMLHVGSAVDLAPELNNPNNIESQVNITGVSKSTKLVVGDKITLINKTENANPDLVEGTEQLEAESGISIIYEFEVGLEGADNAVVATMTGGKTNDKANAVTAGNNVAFLSSLDATLFAASDGIGAFMAQEPLRGGFIPFGIAGGRTTSYNNGQKLDLDGFNFIAGVGATRETGNGYLHLAGFAETGHQTYNASSHFVSGKGNVNYMGGGVMARLSLLNGLYAEGLIRAGSSDIAYDTSDFNVPVGYDFSSAYLGGYAGLGYTRALQERLTWGLHGKYIYSWTDGNHAELAGEDTHFKQASAHTFRVGSSLAYALESGLTPYGSLSWDYTSGNKMEATVSGRELEPTDINGHTGTLQLGLNYSKPESNWSADLSAAGYTGVRDGLAANAAVQMTF